MIDRYKTTLKRSYNRDITYNYRGKTDIGPRVRFPPRASDPFVKEARVAHEELMKERGIVNTITVIKRER